MRRKSIVSQPGSQFHQLVSLIEKAAAQDRHLLVQAPQRLIDADTGRLREHDIVVTYSRAHHRLVTAIECRDRARKIGVPDVEAFAKKCERTGVHRGIMVSSSGFRQTAITKANEMNIACMNLASAARFDWCAMTHLSQRSTHIADIRIQVDVGAKVDSGTKLYASGDIEITQDALLSVANHYFYASPDIATLPPGKHQHTLRDKNSGLVARTSDGNELAVKKVDFTYDFEHSETLRPARFRSYFDATTGEVSAEVVSFDLHLHGFEGNLSIVRDGSDSMKVMLAGRKL